MKNILLTGVSKGLGLETCRNLLAAGYNVYGVSRTRSDEIDELINNDSNFTHLSYDLKDVENIKNDLLKKELLHEVPIHGFVNNAAYAYNDIITNLSSDRLNEMYQVNVFSPLMITKFVLRNMLLNRVEGSLVHISSISVHTGYKGLAMYASTKGALEAFSKNTAREWGVKGIRSNCIVAGFMETSMSSGLTTDQKNRIYNRTSLKKPTEMESVASMVEYLVSEKASSITGQNLYVDSGTI